MKQTYWQQLAQTGFCLLLFLLLTSHASQANGGPFTWLPLPLPDARAITGWHIGVLAFLPLTTLIAWWKGRGKNSWDWGKTAVTLPLALLTIWAFTYLSSWQILPRLVMLGLFWFILLFLNNQPTWDRRTLFYSLAGVLLVQGTVGVVQFITQKEIGLTWLGELPLDATQEGMSVVQRESGHWLRAYGLNSHPNQFGLVMMALLLIIWPRRRAVTGGERWLFWLAMAAGAAGLLVSLSRSAWTGLVVGLAVFSWRQWQAGDLKLRPSRELLIPLSLVIAALLLFVGGYGDALASRFLTLDAPLESRSLWERERDVTLAWTLLRTQPIRGVGLGDYETAAVGLDQAAEIVHNMPLLMGAELGLLGILIWLVWWLAPIILYGRSPVYTHALAVWLALITFGLVQPEPHLILPKGAVLWGLAAASWQRERMLC